MEHISVLKKETIELLNIKSNGIYLDFTLGRGGHSSEILKRLSKGKLIAFDLDETAIKESKPILDKVSSNYELIHSNFKYFDKELSKRNISKVDGILIDLGVSSPQFDDPSRGFSYNFDTTLDMRMDLKSKLTAKYIINNYSLNELTRVFKDYGEDKDAYKIAKAIIKERETKEINTTFELIEIIKKNKSRIELNKKGHPAKQIFQALRIEVNDEINSLKETIFKALDYLNKDGILVIISFHSLEDRIVKQAFNKVSKVIGDRNDDYSLPNKNDVHFKLINKDVIIASEEELKNNRRAKSAKLRAIKRIN